MPESTNKRQGQKKATGKKPSSRAKRTTQKTDTDEFDFFGNESEKTGKNAKADNRTTTKKVGEDTDSDFFGTRTSTPKKQPDKNKPKSKKKPSSEDPNKTDQIKRQKPGQSKRRTQKPSPKKRNANQTGLGKPSKVESVQSSPSFDRLAKKPSPPTSAPTRKPPSAPPKGTPSKALPTKGAPVAKTRKTRPPGSRPTKKPPIGSPQKNPVRSKPSTPPASSSTPFLIPKKPNTSTPNLPLSRKEKRERKHQAETQYQQNRWASNRLAVPYHTDGPKITLGVIWFLAIFAATLYRPAAAAAVAAPVAGLAGLQAAHAWFRGLPAQWWTGLSAALITVSGVYGPLGLSIATAASMALLLTYIGLGKGHHRSSSQLFDVLLRSALPGGLAAGSLVALGQIDTFAAVGLILLISSYEAGDFVVGSGSNNAFEGPLAGYVGMIIMAFILAMIVPEPYNIVTVITMSSIAAISAISGQVFASATLPRGDAWAPGLRRLDSYLVAAPFWLLLVHLL